MKVARQLQKRYRGKRRKLWWTFVDLEKTFDRVLRKVVEWVMRKLGVGVVSKSSDGVHLMEFTQGAAE